MAIKHEERNEQNLELVGYHKGSLETLIKERNELLRMVSITEQLINAHLEGLKQQGVDIDKLFQQAQKEEKKK